MKNKLMFATIVIKLSSLTQCIFPYTEEKEQRRGRETEEGGRERGEGERESRGMS